MKDTLLFTRISFAQDLVSPLSFRTIIKL